MRRSALLAVAFLLACVSPVPDVSSFPARQGAVYVPDCCGEPIVQTKPEVPAAAMRSGQSGWVVVSGILDERGWVIDPTVLASEPEGVFDKAAVAAYDGWRYAVPTSDPGVRHEVRAVIQFRSERARGSPSMGGGVPSGGGGGGNTY
jgi:TonB family protein